MFLRRYTRTKSGKTHSYYALVESMRTDDGPRQRVVAHLGELNHNEEAPGNGPLSSIIVTEKLSSFDYFPTTAFRCRRSRTSFV